MKISGIKDCVELYAKERGISKAQAEIEFKTALNVIADLCVDGGVSFKNLFTIKKKVQKGRTGSVNGKTYNTEDKNTLKISVGSELNKSLNK